MLNLIKYTMVSLLVFVTSSCIEMTCPDSKRINNTLDVQGVTLVEKVELEAGEQINPTDPLYYDQYSLLFHLQTQPTKSGDEQASQVDQITSSTCAASNEQTLKNPIKSIEFISNKLYDDRHPAGTSLVDILTHVEQQKTLNIILPEMIANIKDKNIPETFSFEVKFAVPPSDVNEHTFTATVTLANGQSFSAAQVQLLKPRS